jgi:hypothetical protein
MNKAIRAITYGSVMAAAVVAALPSHAAGTADRIGSPMMTVVPSGYIAPVAVVQRQTFLTHEGTVREVQVARVEPSAVAGSGVATVAEPVVLLDRGTPVDHAYIISERGRGWVNVNYGDVVQFQVKNADGTSHVVNWRFDGLDNVVRFGDIDPHATWGKNVKVFVNQSYNPLHASDSGRNPI